MIGEIFKKDGVEYIQVKENLAAEIAGYNEVDGKKIPILRTEVVETVDGEKKSVEIKVKTFKMFGKKGE